MFGKLSIEALPSNPIIIGGVVFMGVVAIAIITLLTYYKKWHWLWHEWLTSLDHKKIGIMYIAISILMLVRGMIDAVMMRAQQAVAAGTSQGYLDAHHFDQLFTAHGVIMIFFVAMPFMFGLINIVLPLQLGSRDVAFPFLNNLSFWLFLAGASLVNISLVIGEFAATGWLAYPPLSELAYSPSVGVDYYIWALQISGIGSLLSGINFFVTILKMRCSGMTLMRMPIFPWTVLGSMSLIIAAFPVLTATLAMLSLDRLLGMHFFTSDFGGNAMMYINLIWTWGHPEVYILVLPAFGIFSEIIATFSEKRLFGYTSMVLATMTITLFSFLVWLHHFFTMGAGGNVNAFFGIMTMVIAIPTGVKMFNWLFTMYRGRVTFSSPVHWFLGFVTTFSIGGMTGVLLALPAADFQLHNSLFLVAHFHNMIIGGVLFGYFAGFTYWFPKVFGFTLDERWGKRAFWLWISGFLTAFIPLYVLGFMGATRRLDHYDNLGWQGLFIIAGVGVIIILLGVVAQIYQVYTSIKHRTALKDKTGDPWNGRTLEWSIPSPVPFYNFLTLPHAHGRDTFAMEKSEKRLRKSAQHFEAISLPHNSSLGLLIGVASFVAGFGLVWHIFWLFSLAMLFIFICIIARLFEEETEFTISAHEVEKIYRHLNHQTL